MNVNWEDEDRLPFFTALEKEVASAQLESKSVIIAMDANSKLGPTYIPNDPKSMSKNGKVLAALMERYALYVVNGLKDKSEGLITREMNTINGIERSVIDFVIVNSDLVKHINQIHIDDRRINVLTKNIKTKEGTINN